MPSSSAIQIERGKDSRVVATRAFDAAEVAQAETAALRALASEVRVKGFRPGKAPEHLVRAQVGAAALREETVRQLLPRFLQAAMAEGTIKPILRPSIAITKEEPLTVAATFIERPKATLKKPASITVEKRAIPPASDTDVDAFIGRILAQDRVETPVDRTAAHGDLVVLSLQATEKDGTPFAALTVPSYSLVIGSEELLPELSEHVTGMTKGAKKKATVTFAADHEIPALQKKTLTIEMTATDVRSVTLPALTAEYLHNRLKMEKTPDAFRSDVRDMLTARARDTEMKRREEELMDKVRAATTVALPTELVDAEAQELLMEFVERLKEKNSTLERWMAETSKKPDQVLAEMRDAATKRATLRLGMQELATSLSITLSQEEIQAELAQHGGDKDTEPGTERYEAAVFNGTMRKLVETMIADAEEKKPA